MATIAQNLEILSTHLEDAYDALEAKGATIPAIHNATNLSATVNSIPTNTLGEVSGEDIIFRDYDGTILYSYSISDFNDMTELPPLPTRSGLICQGWNNTLQSIKTAAGKCGWCEIGALYVTDDNKTRYHITINDKLQNKVVFQFFQDTAYGVKLNWGDGTQDETFSTASTSTTVKAEHTYQPNTYPANYVITLETVSGNLWLSRQYDYTDSRIFTEINLGDNINLIGSYAFKDCFNLTAISFSNLTLYSSSNRRYISSNSFENCYKLKYVALPMNFAPYNGVNIYVNCFSLINVSWDYSNTNFSPFSDKTYQNCYSLERVYIDSNYSGVVGTQYLFQGCGSLKKVYINRYNRTISLGQYAFADCHNLESINFGDTPVITNIGNYVFSHCESLKSLNLQVVNATTLGSGACAYMTALEKITLPPNLTSISGPVIRNSTTLQRIKIPKTVGSIATYSFRDCSSLKIVDFHEHTSIPSLAGTSAFQNTPTTREIVVPDDLYDSWKTATNWSSTTNNIVDSIVKYSESSIYGE